MILSDVCKVSIRLISFHLFLSYFVCDLNLILEDISYIG